MNNKEESILAGEDCKGFSLMRNELT